MQVIFAFLLTLLTMGNYISRAAMHIFTFNNSFLWCACVLSFWDCLSSYILFLLGLKCFSQHFKNHIQKSERKRFQCQSLWQSNDSRTSPMHSCESETVKRKIIGELKFWCNLYSLHSDLRKEACQNIKITRESIERNYLLYYVSNVFFLQDACIYKKKNCSDTEETYMHVHTWRLSVY